MRRDFLFSLVGTIILACLTGVSQAYPTWAEELGVDFWNLPTLHQRTEECQRLGDEMDSRLEVTQRRMAMKKQVANELIAGELTLCEAAVIFRNLNAENTQFLPLVRLQFPGRSDAECHFRSTIECVRSVFLTAPARDEIVARFERELDQPRELD